MFRQRIPLVRLGGIAVQLDPSWILLAALISWTLAVGVFPAFHPGLSGGTYWIMGLAGALGLFVSILLHELSHSWVARRHGIPIRGITLFLFGGVAEMEAEPETPRIEFRMAAAGPIASVLIGVAFHAAGTFAAQAAWPASVVGVVTYLADMNFVLAAFNLIPAFPLDGGRILRAGLWHWNKDLARATGWAATFGTLFGMGLMVLGVLQFFGGALIAGVWWFLIGMFVRGSAKAAYQHVLLQQALADEPIGRFVAPDPYPPAPETTVRELMELGLRRAETRSFPVVQGAELVGRVDLTDLQSVAPERRAFTRLRDLMHPVADNERVDANLAATQALGALQRSDVLFVMDSGQFVGTIGLRDLLGKVALKLELEQRRDSREAA